MKRTKITALVLCATLDLSGCGSMNNTTKGGLIGGGGGAAAGAIIGGLIGKGKGAAPVGGVGQHGVDLGLVFKGKSFKWDHRLLRFCD